VGLLDDLVGLGAGFAQRFGDLLLGHGKILLAAVGGGQAFGDLGLTLFDGRHDVRPAELHHDPGDSEERQTLDDQGDVDIHVLLLCAGGAMPPANQYRGGD
jgi:hypothetical protein